MFLARPSRIISKNIFRLSLRPFASATSPTHSLLFIEHRSGELEAGSLSALTAASKLGGKVTALIVGGPGEVDTIVAKVKAFDTVSGILHSTSDAYKNNLAETIAPLLADVLRTSDQYTHFVSSHSSNAKNIIPRLSGILSIPMVSDVLSAEHSESEGTTTYTRPIYAGNAIATVQAPSSIPLKIFTIRQTAFDKAQPSSSGPSTAEVKAIEPIFPENVPTTHRSLSFAKSDRPELGSASRVVSGGRALKNAETFKNTIEPLADALGAAIGASRAAVDAGYVDNSLQVGQTGKVVAPELYVAVGISGAIQHLAGMKDSKMIVAINKDPDAPIFQVADVGLVADLYEAVPELVKRLKN
ncbi:uncharacterized protein EI90DRAFT_3144815 [Cantharellus anzutake]|uniref:uncharacterized protein n=1 Tax=Cantharellus anzutake TaxID=1750568 RepID=UPI0019052DFE|nr:uncharacterized protein EI90DRAFT_3144815 [Cantharellus anzutake]KAF8335889.1 hypothetical protein EI90DRAFT_3144815 [Cantharellus anzutake]